MQVGVIEPGQHVTGVFPEVWIGHGQGGLYERVGQVLWIGRIERDVAARGFGRRKGLEYMLSTAVVDARGLQQQTIGRVEQAWQGLHRGQVTRQFGIVKSCPQNKQRQEQAEHEGEAECKATCARFHTAASGLAAVTATAEEGGDVSHQ
jgi:hypothetical protein